MTDCLRDFIGMIRKEKTKINPRRQTHKIKK